jgi:hypothetical protein
LRSRLIAILLFVGCLLTLGLYWYEQRPLRPGEVYAKRYRMWKRIYHVKGCPWGLKIGSWTRFPSWQVAERAGYRPCKVCRPHSSRWFVG